MVKSHALETSVNMSQEAVGTILILTTVMMTAMTAMMIAMIETTIAIAIEIAKTSEIANASANASANVNEIVNVVVETSNANVNYHTFANARVVTNVSAAKNARAVMIESEDINALVTHLTTNVNAGIIVITMITTQGRPEDSTTEKISTVMDILMEIDLQIVIIPTATGEILIGMALVAVIAVVEATAETIETIVVAQIATKVVRKTMRQA